MTPSALEAWVLRVVDQVARGEHAEDSRVELKREWPKPPVAARQIAGHANASRGASILWIVGLDEKTGIHGAPLEELANWYGSVKQNFDGIAPELYDLNVAAGGKTLVALLFETDRAPYVVKNAGYGSPGGGSVELEVPWREGRSTCSARREHLLRLLVPAVELPEVEVLSCSVSAIAEVRPNSEEVERWYMRGSLYLTPRGSDVVIPFHRARVSITQGIELHIVRWRGFRMFPPGRFGMSGDAISSRVDSATVTSTSSEVILSGPGRVHFEAQINHPFKGVAADKPLEAKLALSIVGVEIPLSFSLALLTKAPEKHVKMAWAVDDAA
jgi:hypothetical protein